MKHRTLLTIASLAVAFSFPALAASDIENGEKLAKSWCVNCHDVSGETSSDLAPGFASIVANPKRTADSLKVFLHDPHPPMPKFQLTSQEVNDLVAYLLSLRQR